MTENSLLSAVSGSGIAAIFAVIMFIIYSREKRSDALIASALAEAHTKRIREMHEEAIARLIDERNAANAINRELIDCRERETTSRSDLASSLTTLSEVVRKCSR